MHPIGKKWLSPSKSTVSRELNHFLVANLTGNLFCLANLAVKFDFGTQKRLKPILGRKKVPKMRFLIFLTGKIKFYREVW